MGQDLRLERVLALRAKIDTLNRINQLPEATITKLTQGLHTHSHTSYLISDWEDKGYVEAHKVGRKRIVSLTKKGKELLPHLNAIYQDLEIFYPKKFV